MAVTYGFYNSLNGDRTYNAEQMSAIFDGIITDGVFSTIGDALMTIAGTGMQVIVKTGKCWFNSTWTLNDAPMTLAIDTADVSLTRIDAVVLEVNSGVSIRANSIKILKGTPSANPAKPTLASDEDLHQYALAYVTVGAGVTSIAASNIEVNVGKTTCPFITSVLQQTSITDLFNAWDEEFNTWFENLQSQMEGDVATNLQNQIDGLKIGSTAKAQYNLTSSLPNDYIEWIGKYNEYWWSLLHGQAYSYYTYTFNRAAVGTGSTEILKWTGTGAKTLYWADSVTGSGENNSKVILVDPQFKTYTLTTYNVNGKKAVGDELAADIPSLLGKYIKSSDSDTVYYVPSNATYPRSAGMGDYASYTIFALEKAVLGFYHDVDGDVSPLGQIVTAVPTVVNVPAGGTTYEHSTNRNAYPDSGTVDGVTYTYLGKPFEKFPTMPQIETGTYIGTGTYGSGNPNSLTFSFVPKFLMVHSSAQVGYANLSGNYFVIIPDALDVNYRYNSIFPHSRSTYANFYAKKSSDGKTINWYHTDNYGYQLNASGAYYYVAFG